MQEHIRAILTQLGEDPKREGLIKTPERVERLLRTLTSANQQSLEAFINEASLFSSKIEEMIFVKNIAFYSLCEHHLLPFIGYCHIAYIPNGKIIGFSKIPQLVDFYARRLQIQENLTQQIAENLLRILNAKGVGVIMEAKHFCMMIRDIKRKDISIRTSAMLGLFQNNKRIRAEFLNTLPPSFGKQWM